MTALSLPDAEVSSIVDLTADLVRIPSRAERGELVEILQFLRRWIHDHGAVVDTLTDGDGREVALVVTVDSGWPGSAVALNACLDTAGFGDESAWSHPPTGAEIEDGWLYGRGAADSKVAAAMFAHLALELVASPPPTGKLLVLFDVDEHSGRFGGAKAFQAVAPPLVGMMIGYPGNFGVVAGARGFWRATITTFATATHSGSSQVRPQNAISKAARLIAALEDRELPADAGPGFPFGPKLTVTAVTGGEGYSQVPDRCEVKIDVRLTPAFTAEDAAALVAAAVRQVDVDHPTRRATAVEVRESWPAYRLPADSPLANALRRGAERHLDRDVPAVVCGPSNIGNYLAAHGVPATCGFGVTYRNIHGTDEAIELATIAPVYAAYRDAVLDLLA
jgi:succinyl-diaminopimelate desuccinylase